MRIALSDPALKRRLLEVLARGGVAVMPCDTIYGFVGIAPDTEERIRALKGRAEKSFLQLIPSALWLARFTALELPASLSAYWPGPLTIIFPALPGGTVALRVPDDALLREVMEHLKRPLFSTSVNRSGEPALWRIEEIASAFESRTDLIVDAGDLEGRTPSTILDVTSRPFQVLRPGTLELPARALE